MPELDGLRSHLVPGAAGGCDAKIRSDGRTKKFRINCGSFLPPPKSCRIDFASLLRVHLLLRASRKMRAFLRRAFLLPASVRPLDDSVMATISRVSFFPQPRTSQHFGKKGMKERGLRIARAAREKANSLCSSKTATGMNPTFAAALSFSLVNLRTVRARSRN